MTTFEEAAWKQPESDLEKKIGSRIELDINPQLPLTGTPAKPGDVEQIEKTKCQADYLDMT